MVVAGVAETSTKCCLHLFLWLLVSLSGYLALLLPVYTKYELQSEKRPIQYLKCYM